MTMSSSTKTTRSPRAFSMSPLRATPGWTTFIVSTTASGNALEDQVGDPLVAVHCHQQLEGRSLLLRGQAGQERPKHRAVASGQQADAELWIL